MTPDDRELARYLAERLMGWRKEYIDLHNIYVWVEDDGTFYGKRRRADGSEAWNPTNSEDHAMLVVHALVARGLYVCIESPGHGPADTTWRCSVGDGYYADAPRLPRAIAEAARAALEGEQV